MRLVVRIVVAIISVAWLVPFSLAFFAVWDFQWTVLRPIVFFNAPHNVTPFNLIEYADVLYGIGVVWLAAVIVCWAFYLTRARSE